MKTTLDWLRRHLETDVPPGAIAERLVGLGHEVEGVVDRAAELAPFTVAYVIEAKPHPNADRLRVCRVDTGKGEVQVVCGAPNARTGMKGVFAPSGTTIPGTGLKLKPSEIRGVASNGMLCSEREMGLGDNHDGIIDLPDDAPVGQPFATVMGLGDPILDIKVTPDRGDCLGVRGLARDLAAGGAGGLKPYDIKPVPGTFRSKVGVHLRLPAKAANACPLFVGREFRGVKNGPSPAWLKDKLVAVGLRPISALVDITNWLTLDLCRPAHVYDVAKLTGDIHVRLGRTGESVLALNGKTYALDDTMTAIADDAGPLGLGGIIGGESTGCSDDTTNVFIEIALFDPLRTAATGRRLGIESDARYRFERGVDPAFALPGVEEASRLILELCGGTASELVIAGDPSVAPKALGLRPARIKSLGGLDVAADAARRSLEALGCRVDAAGGERWTVGLPTWRHDLLVEGDLVEEVLRLNSFDAIPPVSLPRARPLTRPMLTTRQMRARWAKRALADRGLVEAVTYSFLPRAHAELFSGGNGPNPELRLANPISADLDWMRPSTLPNLVAAAGRNLARGVREAAIFEVGPAYIDATPTGQALVAGAVRRGDSGPRHWRVKPRPVDALDAKADALAVLAACGLTGGISAAAGGPPWYHPGRAGQLRLGNIVVADFGDVHPRVLAAMDVTGPAVGCEVYLDRVPEPKSKGSRTRPALELSPFQAVERDFAFVVDASVAADAIVKAAKGVDRTLVADVTVFDLYRGKGLPDGKVSLALSVTLQPTKATLTDAEIDAIGQKIVAAVAKATGATLRT